MPSRSPPTSRSSRWGPAGSTPLRSRCSSRCSRRRRSRGSSRCARCASRATTRSRPPRPPRVSGTGCATGPARRGRRPRARAERHRLGACPYCALTLIRRIVDIVVAGAGLLVSAPVLAVAVIAVRLESPGPVIYRQRRAGLGGRPFDVLKLRTMVDRAEHIGAGLAVNQDDPRITRVGALLRRTSLDELPNLLNVLRGEMSLIGPRPTLPAQVAQYTERQRGRLAVRPGITGWAQVHGRASLPWAERIELDLYYVEHRTPAVDLKILLRTPRALFGGTYKGE